VFELGEKAPLGQKRGGESQEEKRSYKTPLAFNHWVL